MKTRHTRLFASVSAAALIGITALTPTATAQDNNGPLDPWNLNYHTQQVIDQLNSLGYSDPLNDVDDILAAVENIRNDANGGQDEVAVFLELLADYIQMPSYNPPAGPVYNEQGQLRDRYTFYYGDDVTSDSTPSFLDSMNGDTIVGEDGLPVNKEEGWLVPNGQDIVPPSADDEDEDEGGSTGGDSGNEGGDNDSDVEGGDTSDTEQEVVDENGNPLDGLNVTIEDDRIEVSFPVDLAGNPHTLTASLDAENGFTVTLTPGSESSTGGGSSNNGGGSSNGSSNGGSDQDDDSTVISNPEVTPVYIDANGNVYPAEFDDEDNMLPPEGLADGTYRLGFQLTGEDGAETIVGTDYSVEVDDGNMTKADDDTNNAVGNGNSDSGDNSSTAKFNPAVSNLESLGAGGGGTDVGGDGTDSDATNMQNAANMQDGGDGTSNHTPGNSNDANDVPPAGGSNHNGQGGGPNPDPATTYDNGPQTHASGQENLAVTGTNTNTLMAMVGGLLLAAAGVLLVGRRRGWV